MNWNKINGVTPVGRLLRMPLRLVRPEARIRVLYGPLRGAKWIVGSAAHGCWIGTYERHKQRAFARALKPGQIIYDLGANVGFYSLLASAAVGVIGHVYCFEPNEQPLRFLRLHLQENNALNCSIMPVAVANKDGQAKFQIGPSNNTGKLADSGVLSASVVKIDTLVAAGDILAPDVIKCDIEGGEYNALLGAACVLTKHRPKIFLATHGDDIHKNCCDFLVDIGYSLSPLDGKALDRSCEILAF